MSHNAISSGDSNTLLLITVWKSDDVSSQSELAKVRGQGGDGGGGGASWQSLLCSKTLSHTNCGSDQT